jgi:hypothetical protein
LGYTFSAEQNYCSFLVVTVTNGDVWSLGFDVYVQFFITYIIDSLIPGSSPYLPRVALLLGMLLVCNKGQPLRVGGTSGGTTRKHCWIHQTGVNIDEVL